ncbi:probable ATP-dependent RNA helicase spindle-E [Daphnia pulicaria]|uniref:probable ATP-dependent RNA helicase spindle-E n=1 Tax=Daphnia pulicaria TaxID=35523 RepID=UPI001EEC14A0|nr:probable ATP-dependent RNA helicase spindle-E [Daphnia pulicaria]
MLKKENAIIIKGFTGCGKTTQVPQFILDECYANKTPCNIVVTQPRRIAAISIAKRVCFERNWTLGTVVGYRVGMERQVSESTLLTYVTTGCLLETLVARKTLEGYTHIVVDEVHERDEDTDFLLLVLNRFLRKTKTPTKIILMSATADAGKFSQYFKTPELGDFPQGDRPWRNAPIINVDRAEPFNINVYYMDCLKQLGFLTATIDPNDETPRIDKLQYELVSRLISAFDSKREIKRYGRHSEYENISSVRSAVLIFLPGTGEIDAMHKALVDFETNAVHKNYWHILPLHSRITSEEQSRVFQSITCLPTNFRHFRKIILSTNIAESSITVPDITYIIDFCLTKQLTTDTETNFCSLKLEWAAKSNCMQRRGRVGRVTEGVVYRMVSKRFYDEKLPDDVTPEILRSPLEQTVLRTKLLDLDPPEKMLALVIDPPKHGNIARTILLLKEMGALFTTVNGVVSSFDGDLSYLGRVLSRLPIDVHLGKLVMLGYVFNILEECIIMAAGLSSKNIFTSPYQKKLLAYQVKMQWADGSFSDPIATLNAYQVYKNLEHQEHFKRSGASERMREKNWAHDNFIELKALKEMDMLVKEIKFRLHSIGIEGVVGPNVRPLTGSQKALLLRVVLFGAFYPNYFTRDAVCGQIDEREAVKSLCGLDPFQTVKLTNFPPNQLGKAYVRQIKNSMSEIFSMLRVDTWNAKITFDSQRVFIQFHQEGNPYQSMSVPGRICLPVYLAIKQRFLGIPYHVRLFDKRDAENYRARVEESARRLLLMSDVESVVSSQSIPSEVPYVLQIPAPRLPELHEYEIPVSVCHVDEPNHFWCHRLDSRSKRDYTQIIGLVGPQGSRLERWDITVPVVKGNLVMGPFKSAVHNVVEYYRAKVLSTQQGVPIHEKRVRLYFIDFGNAAVAHVKDLRVVPDGLLKFPPLAIECHLTGVGPSLINDPIGKWTNSGKEWFEMQTVDQVLTARVFSVVNGITSMDLIGEGGSWENSIAAQMLELKYAVKVDESFINKRDNEQRQSEQEAEPNSRMAKHRQRELEKQRFVVAEYLAMELEVDEPRQYSRNETCVVKLVGPSSPLEMNMYGKVQSLLGTMVKIENDSVNSVILEDQPGDHHERVLVAAHVGSQQNGRHVQARSTTLLPNIPGLPAILTLLFAPRAEFRADKDIKRLTGAICGLGYDHEKQQSFYPEHDMELNFDSEIGLTDVLLINKIRFWLNSVMGALSFSQHHAAPSQERMREVSQKTLGYLFELITKSRGDVEFLPSTSYKWNLIKTEHLLQSDVAERRLHTLIPLHDCIKLNP